MSRGNGKDWLAPYVGAAALVGFAAFVVYLLRLTQANETEWARTIYVFAGVEALAFAAAGFFFGREVNRARAEQAERQAADATTEAAAKAVVGEERGKGRALAAAIEAKATAAGLGPVPESYDAGAAAAERPSDLAELAQVARELFPPA